MSTGWSLYTKEEINFLQAGLDATKSYAVIRQEFTEKFGKTMNRGSLAGLIHRKRLTAPVWKKHRRPNAAEAARRRTQVIELCKAGLRPEKIAEKTGFGGGYIRQILREEKLVWRKPKPQVRFRDRPRVKGKRRLGYRNGGRGFWYLPMDGAKELSRDDPIADIGLSLLDLQANSCRFPVAREPVTLRQRFCGAPRMMNGPYFASAYCVEHHERCYRAVPVCEAAE